MQFEKRNFLRRLLYSRAKKGLTMLGLFSSGRVGAHEDACGGRSLMGSTMHLDYYSSEDKFSNGLPQGPGGKRIGSPEER